MNKTNVKRGMSYNPWWQPLKDVFKWVRAQPEKGFSGHQPSKSGSGLGEKENSLKIGRKQFDQRREDES